MDFSSLLPLLHSSILSLFSFPLFTLSLLSRPYFSLPLFSQPLFSLPLFSRPLYRVSLFLYLLFSTSPHFFFFILSIPLGPSRAKCGIRVRNWKRRFLVRFHAFDFEVRTCFATRVFLSFSLPSSLFFFSRFFFFLLPSHFFFFLPSSLFSSLILFSLFPFNSFFNIYLLLKNIFSLFWKFNF